LRNVFDVEKSMRASILNIRPMQPSTSGRIFDITDNDDFDRGNRRLSLICMPDVKATNSIASCIDEK
jgi:hypothetical protein